MPAVLMPRLSDSMEEGTIVAWLVADGAPVSAGDEIVEIESDKATTAYAADESGVLRIAAASGTVVPAGAQIARIEVDGVASVPVVVPAGGASKVGAIPGVGTGTDLDTASEVGAVTEARAELNGGTDAGPGASTAEIDSATVAERAARPPVTEPVPAVGVERATRATTTPTLDGVRFREPSRIERLVSKRMVQSRTEIPDFAVTVEIDMAAALAMRADLKRVGGKRIPSVNDLIVKACALTLRDHPRVNSAWVDDRIAEYEHVNIGVAVATDDEQLVVPVIHDCDRLTLGELAVQARELTKRARAGRVTPQDLSGGTFTVSNLGMLGVSHFSAIISPGQGAILAVGSTVTKFVAVDDQPVARPVMTATLCSDHRVIYGAHAAAFLDRLRTMLEHPSSLAL